MTREELKERVSKLIQTLENVERSLQFTNIPVQLHHKKLKRSWQRKKSKSRPSKKSLQSTLRRCQERSPALQRREEEAAGTDHHQYPRLHYLGPCGQPSQDPCRRETSSSVYRRKDAYLVDPDLAQGLRKAGISLSRYIE